VQILYIIILILLVIPSFVITAVIFFNFVFPILWGAPYAPSNISDIKAALSFAKIKPGETAADLGSGDGRAVIMMAELGANAVGFEISPILVFWSRMKARKAGNEIASKTKFFRKSFWDIDLSNYDVIFLYQLPYVMKRLRGKISKELKGTGRVVCIGFKLEGWTPTDTNGRVFVYQLQ
jgi:ribosomal protein L11 methylase PrmA